MKNEINKYTNTWNMWWALQLILPFILGICLFIFNIKMSKLLLIVLWFVSISGCIIIFKKKICEINIKLIPILILIMIVSMLIQASILDTTWDGQAYHYDAIRAIMDGWNPLYNMNFDRIGEMNFIYSEHYPKATWIFSAFYSTIFNNIEVAKVYNIYALCLLVGISASYINNRFNNIKWYNKILILICIMLNPICIGQINTFYVDGYIGCLFLSFCISTYMSFIEKSILNTIISCITMILIINTKFTGLGYIGIVGVYLLISIIKKQRNQEYLWKELFIPLVITGIISVSCFGFDSYIRNTIDHGHPFYPISGKGAVDIMTANTPISFRNDNYLEKFLKSYLSETSSGMEHKIKIPIKISLDEFKEMNTDTRIAGFGPLFLLSIIISVIGIVVVGKNRRRELIILILPILFTIIINPENWWARYIPQFWFIPILICIICSNEEMNKLSTWIGKIGILIILINSLVSAVYLIEKQVVNSSTQKKSLEYLNNYKKVYIKIDEFGIRALDYRLRTMGTDIEIVDDIEVIKNKDNIYIPNTFGVEIAVEK